MVSVYSGCVGEGPDYGCKGGSTMRIVFPVFRTVTCKLWHKAGCAPDTLLPGWYDGLLNVINVPIIAGLAYISIRLAHNVGKS